MNDCSTKGDEVRWLNAKALLLELFKAHPEPFDPREVSYTDSSLDDLIELGMAHVITWAKVTPTRREPGSIGLTPIGVKVAKNLVEQAEAQR